MSAVARETTDELELWEELLAGVTVVSASSSACSHCDGGGSVGELQLEATAENSGEDCDNCSSVTA